MADISPLLPAKLIHRAICVEKNLDAETTWVDKQFSKLTIHQQKNWSARKIRKYLLNCYCEEAAVEKKITEIMSRR